MNRASARDRGACDLCAKRPASLVIWFGHPRSPERQRLATVCVYCYAHRLHVTPCPVPGAIGMGDAAEGVAEVAEAARPLELRLVE